MGTAAALLIVLLLVWILEELANIRHELRCRDQKRAWDPELDLPDQQERALGPPVSISENAQGQWEIWQEGGRKKRVKLWVARSREEAEALAKHWR